ncbi:MAG: gamma-glutamyltransferase, partial [Steroidobacteraceae bacterium]
IAPAIQLAEQGFVLAAGDIEMLVYGTEGFRKDPASAAIFLDDGRPFSAGQRLVQKDLGRTLRSISQHGTDGFYKGPVAAALVAASKAGKGIITQADLDRYSTREFAPIECDYRDFHVVTAPPPSGGGIALCEMLNILEGYPLKSMGRGSTQAVHYQIEAMRHAYADRNTYLGDPDFVKNPVQRLISDEYAARIRKLIDPKRAGSSLAIRQGSEVREGSNTTHYSIADGMGNVVAVTYTLNDWFGAHVTAGGTGVLLNNEMDDFTAKEGTPNLYGLVQGGPNRIEPGKAPLSSMTPTIITREGKPLLILGTPGGSRITTAVLLTILNVLVYGMDVQQAVDAPRFHQQWLPEATAVEGGALSPHTRKALERMGHKLGERQPSNHVAAILIGAPALGAKPVGRNRFYGGLDRRRNTGLAMGY